jgi:transposase-like protein
MTQELDASYLKVCHNGTVRSQAVLIAYDANMFGRPEIAGVILRHRLKKQAEAMLSPEANKLPPGSADGEQNR